MKKTLHKGFTLIELLVVVAIIGILASIIITNLVSAQRRAVDTAIIGELTQLRTQLATDANFDGTYVCGASNTFTGDSRSLFDSAVDRSGRDEFEFCGDGTTNFVAAVELRNGDIYCVDGTGFGGLALLPSTGATACTTTAPVIP